MDTNHNHGANSTDVSKETNHSNAVAVDDATNNIQKKSPSTSANAMCNEPVSEEWKSIIAWLESLHYACYAKLFKSNGYDLWEILYDISVDDLKDIGVLPGHAKRIQKLLVERKKKENRQNSRSTSPGNAFGGQPAQTTGHSKSSSSSSSSSSSATVHKQSKSTSPQAVRSLHLNGQQSVNNLNANQLPAAQQRAPLCLQHQQQMTQQRQQHQQQQAQPQTQPQAPPPAPSNVRLLEQQRRASHEGFQQNAIFAGGIKNKLFETMTRVLNGLQQELIQYNGKFAEPINEMHQRIIRLQKLDLRAMSGIWDSKSGLFEPMLRNLTDINSFNQQMWKRIKEYHILSEQQIQASVTQLQQKISDINQLNNVAAYSAAGFNHPFHPPPVPPFHHNSTTPQPGQHGPSSPSPRKLSPGTQQQQQQQQNSPHRQATLPLPAHLQINNVAAATAMKRSRSNSNTPMISNVKCSNLQQTSSNTNSQNNKAAIMHNFPAVFACNSSINMAPIPTLATNNNNNTANTTTNNSNSSSSSNQTPSTISMIQHNPGSPPQTINFPAHILNLLAAENPLNLSNFIMNDSKNKKIKNASGSSSSSSSASMSMAVPDGEEHEDEDVPMKESRNRSHQRKKSKKHHHHHKSRSHAQNNSNAGRKPAYTTGEIQMMKNYDKSKQSVADIIDLQRKMQSIYGIPRSAYGIAQKMYRMGVLSATLPKKLQALQDKTDADKIKIGDGIMNIRKPRGKPRKLPPTATPSNEANTTSATASQPASEDEQNSYYTSSEASQSSHDESSSTASSNNGIQHNPQRIAALLYGEDCGAGSTSTSSSASALHRMDGSIPTRRPPSTNLRRYNAEEVEFIRSLLKEDDCSDAKAMFLKFRERFPCWKDNTESYTKFYQKKWRLGKEAKQLKHIEAMNNGQNKDKSETNKKRKRTSFEFEDAEEMNFAEIKREEMTPPLKKSRSGSHSPQLHNVHVATLGHPEVPPLTPNRETTVKEHKEEPVDHEEQTQPATTNSSNDNTMPVLSLPSITMESDVKQ